MRAIIPRAKITRKKITCTSSISRTLYFIGHHQGNEKISYRTGENMLQVICLIRNSEAEYIKNSDDSTIKRGVVPLKMGKEFEH